NPNEAIRKKALEELRTDLVTDYYIEPGRLFFEELRNRFKDTICGKDGPQAIADNILAKNNLTTVYVPLLAYFALLIQKQT
ncbi:MAG: hypothetical protein ACK4WF_09950, partial [Candidatus Brocadiales bacterium]